VDQWLRGSDARKLVTTSSTLSAIISCAIDIEQRLDLLSRSATSSLLNPSRSAAPTPSRGHSTVGAKSRRLPLARDAR